MIAQPHPSPPHRMRGVYLLPNLLTVAAIFSGFYAVIAAIRGHYFDAAVAILIALVLDGLDGRVARLLQAQSEFGVQLDSLSDMVCFGIAPAITMYTWSLSTLGKPGWVVAFIYTVCTALRLARFNVQTTKIEKRYFYGLPTPAAAAWVASMILISFYYDISGKDIAIPLAIVAIALSWLKVSTVRYRSFKDFDIRNRVPFVIILIFAVVLALIAFNPENILFLLFSAYILSGPVCGLGALYKRRRHHKGKKNDE